jgi:hypothetical protein
MTSNDLATIRDDDNPTTRALTMARAIQQHLSDLYKDDAADDDARTLPRLERAAIRADDLVCALERLVKR